MSHMVILKFKNIFCDIFCLTPNLFKTFQECQHYKDVNFSSQMKDNLKGHPRSFEPAFMPKSF